MFESEICSNCIHLLKASKLRTFDAFEGIMGLVVLLLNNGRLLHVSLTSSAPVLLNGCGINKRRRTHPISAKFPICKSMIILLKPTIQKCLLVPFKICLKELPELLFCHPLKLKLFIIIRQKLQCSLVSAALIEKAFQQ